MGNGCMNAVSPEEDDEDRRSTKKCAAVEYFLRQASIHGDHIVAIQYILNIDNARKQFFEFLRTEYYVGAQKYYEEAIEFLEFETAVVKATTLSQRLGLKDSIKSVSSKRQPEEVRSRRAKWTKNEYVRYQQVISELATVAFPKFLQSKMYARIRAHEKGTLSSLRARLSFDARSVKSVINSAMSSNKTIHSVHSLHSSTRIEQYHPLHKMASSSNIGSMSRAVSSNNWVLSNGDSSKPKDTGTTPIVNEDAVMEISTHNDDSAKANKSHIYGNEEDEGELDVLGSLKVFREPSQFIAGPTHGGGSMTGFVMEHLPPETVTSFAESAVNAFQSQSEAGLLSASSWLPLLLCGVEACPLAFSLVSANYRRSDPVFAYVNNKFESDFGYDRQKLVGKSFSMLLGSVDGNVEVENSLMKAMIKGSAKQFELKIARSDDKPLLCTVCLKPIFDNAGVYKYMICLWAMRRQHHGASTGVTLDTSPSDNQKPGLVTRNASRASSNQSYHSSHSSQGSSHSIVDESGDDLVYTATKDNLRSLLDVLPSRIVEDTIKR